MFANDVLDPFKPPHEIQVPVAAAELPVGDALQASCQFVFHQLGDAAILHSLQLIGGDGAGGKGGAGLLDGFGPQEAAYNIQTERRIGSLGKRHIEIPLQIL